MDSVRARAFGWQRRVVGVVSAVTIVASFVVLSAGVASAATITTPSTNPFSAPGSAGQDPVAFTVSASGYVPGSLVSVEQCDGVDPTTFGWSPTADCDLGSSPAQAIVASDGSVTFPAGDVNHAFVPFKGESPQSLFNCLSAHQVDPNNGLPSYTNCSLRVSSNNNAATSDQVFVTLTLPEAVPSAPPIGVATAGNGAAAVSFSAPATNGGLPVLDYTATCASGSGGATGSATAPAGPIVVTGLTNAKSYTCSVQARNALGSSAASAASNTFVPANTPAVLSPNTNPFAVPADGSQTPVAFTVIASGYAPGSLVSIEQCDGVNPTTFGWSPTADCDLGTSPAQAIVDDNGNVVFDANDVNHAFVPFKGESPQSLFNCLSAHGSDPNNGLASFTHCTLRVSSNNNAPTADQVFVNLTLPESAPAAPAIGSASSGDASAVVTFSPPASDGGAPVLDYTASCASTNGGTAGSATNTSSPITVVGLTNGKTYSCTVTARNGAGTGPASAASNTVVPVTVPGAPTIGVATAGNGAAAVTFTPPASDGGSAVFYYSVTCSSGNGGALGTQTASSSPIIVTGLTNDRTYTCSLVAGNALGTGPSSASSNAFTPTDAPAVLSPNTNPFVVPADASQNPLAATVIASGYVPGSLVSIEQCDGVDPATFGWSPTSDCDLGSSPAQAIVNDDGNVTFAASDVNHAFVPFKGESPQSLFNCLSPHGVDPNNGLPSFTDCTLRVSSNNNAPTADQVFVTLTLPETVPGAPTIGTATAGVASATVTFTPPATDGGSPVLDYTATCTSTNGGATHSATNTASPVTVTTLTNAKTYTCAVTARSAVGSGAASSASNTITLPTAPGAPTAPAAVPGSAAATVHWTAPASNGGSVITGYVVTPFKGTVAQPARTFTGTAVSHVITGLTNATAYTFKVAAKNAVGTGVNSVATAAITVGAPVAPAAPTATSGNAAATLKWVAPASNGAAITGYVVTPFKAGVAQPVRTFTGTAVTQVITGLTNAASYTFKVAAKNSRGTGPASVASAAIIVGTPLAPTAPGATAGHQQATVHWTAPTVTNGAAITAYVVTPYIGTVAQTARTFTGTATSHIVTGLTTGTHYTFKVAAKNSRGTGAQSVATAVVTPT